MAEIKALITSLLAELKTRVDAAKDDEAKKAVREEFLDEIEEHAKDEIYMPIHQPAFNAGRAVDAKAKGKADAKLKEHTDRIAELESELEETKKAKPDVVAIEDKYKKQLSKAQADLETERTTNAKRERDRLISDAQSNVEKALVAAKMRPRAAQREAVALVANGLIRLNEDGTAIEIRQLKDPATPYAASKAGQPLEALVRDLVKDADPLDLLSNVDRGGGTRGGNASGMPSGVFANGRPMPEGVSQELIDQKAAAMGV